MKAPVILSALFVMGTAWAAAGLPGEGKKIVFVAGTPSHGYGAHEFNAGCLLMANWLREAMPGLQTAVHFNGWPGDAETAFDGADSVVVFSNGGDGHLIKGHLDEVDALLERGVGLVCLHYAVEVPVGPMAERLLRGIGGYFEMHWSVNPHWTAEFKEIPEHPVTRGVEPFRLDDEWYYHMRFVEGMEGVAPVLSAHPPAETLERPDGPHSGNPAVRKAVAEGEIQHLAWCFEREGGGRGFGCTGLHYHRNFMENNFRKLVLNAVLWTAGVEPAEGGLDTPAPSAEEIEANQDYPKPEKES